MKVFGKPLELYSSILVPGKLPIPINEVDPLSKGIVWTAAPFEITPPGENPMSSAATPP